MILCHLSTSQVRPHPRRTESGERCQLGHRDAFSLIEVIAVMAIIGILAVAVLPVLIRQIDYASQGSEDTNLVTLAAGFTQGSLARRYIPGPANSDWQTNIAANIGWQTNAVQFNARNNARAFLVDPNLVIAATTAATLPYQQISSGSHSPPINPRFIILSSLSSPLPCSSGVPSSSDFNALWNCTNDTVPSGTSWSFTGQGSDLKIQRVNLASSFVHLVLTDSDPGNAYYNIDSFVVTNGTLDAYFLKGTVLNLYYGANGASLQASQVLQQNSSWFFCNGLWRNAPCPVSFAGLGTNVQAFYTSDANPEATTTPSTIYADMTNFMNLYLQFAAGGFQEPSAAETSLQNAASKIKNDTQNLVQ